MNRLSSAERRLLPRRVFACPETRNYPLNDAAHVRNALARWSQSRTIKCEGGLDKICAAADRLGISSSVCGTEKGRPRRRWFD